jgi:hypothetical protein
MKKATRQRVAFSVMCYFEFVLFIDDLDETGSGESGC